MDPLASADNANPRFNVVIDSLGSASLNSATAIARGLGISAAQVVHCLYRAPAVLADRLDMAVAQQLADVLRGIGYDARAVTTDSCDLAPAALYDLAIYLRDPAQLDTAVVRLTQFIGLDQAAALRAIITPPGLVLGSVSQATVDAFRRHIGESLEVIAAPQIGATYTLVLGDCHDMLRNRLLDDLVRAGITPLADSGVIATDIPSEQLAPLWQRHKTNASLRLVNTAFLRFDLVLDAPPSAPLNAQARQILSDQLDIPREYLDAIVAATPVTLIESIANEPLTQLLHALAPLQLALSANLTSFQTLGLAIESAEQPLQTFAVLDSYSLATPALNRQDPHKFFPYVVHEKLPEIQARIVRAALEASGATVNFIET